MNKHEMACEVEHCQLADLAQISITGNEADGAEFVAICNDYLSHFCKPIREREGDEECSFCPKCGEEQNGFTAMFGLGVGVEWDLAHGEARCTGCRWPYRGLHAIADPKGGEPLLKISGLFLAYHPDDVEVRTTGDKIVEALRGEGG